MSATSKRQIVLQRLLANGSLAESQCSRALSTFIAPLIGANVLAWKKSGAGRRLAVQNHAALAEFLSRKFPKSESEVQHLPTRVQAVARFRDTKRIRGTGEKIICVRGWRDGALLHNGSSVPVAKMTADCGLLAFLRRSVEPPFSISRGKPRIGENFHLEPGCDRKKARFEAMIPFPKIVSREKIKVVTPIGTYLELGTQF